MKIIRLFAAIWIFWSLAFGCIENPGLTQVSTSLPKQSPISDTTASADITSSASAGPNLPRPSSTETPTIPVDARLKIQCLEIKPTLPSDLASEGVLVLDNQADRGDGLSRRESFMLNMATRSRTQITRPNENITDFAVSPNQELIAYYRGFRNASDTQTLEHDMVIASSDGKPLRVIPWDQDKGSLRSWLDNRHLLLSTGFVEDSGWRKPTYRLWDPLTDERQSLAPDFPAYYLGPHPSDWDGISYAPMLDRVVYARSDGGIGGPFHHVLWDLEKNKSLATLDNLENDLGLNDIPIWFQDGSRFAIGLDTSDLAYELFVVDREGTVKRISNMTAYYPSVYIDDLSWSPDGTKIAFWFSSWPTNPGSDTTAPRFLGIADVATGDVKNYCVPGDYAAGRVISRVPAPLWSPDGRQLVVQNLYAEGHSRVLLVDLEAGIVAQIAEDMEPVGWMK